MISEREITTTSELAPINRSYISWKNALDAVGAALLLAALSPLLLLVALAIRLDSRGPAIYRQRRVGKLGSDFVILKFRTMKVDAPVLSTADMQKQKAIPFTRIGPFLRKTNLDELPQLWNILKGQMSFIGPRPALPTQEDVVNLRRRLGADRVRPGITGLAQVMGRDELDVDSKVGYDAEYCRNLSLALDLKVFCLTFVAVLSAKGNK